MLSLSLILALVFSGLGATVLTATLKVSLVAFPLSSGGVFFKPFHPSDTFLPSRFRRIGKKSCLLPVSGG